MSGIQLSFEQLREDIFNDILKSLERTSYSDLHTAILSGKDPRQMLTPRPEDAMLMGSYGTLNLQFNVPDDHPVSLSVVLTMGRLAYTIQSDIYVAERANLLKESLIHLGAELGMNCVNRSVGGIVRFEYSTSGVGMSTSETLAILESPQMESAFKESVLLQVDRLVVGVADLIASAGIHKTAPPGFFAICQINRAHDERMAEQILSNHFRIIAKDARDPINVIYGLISNDPDAKPLSTCAYVEEELRDNGFKCAFRPTYKYETEESAE